MPSIHVPEPLHPEPPASYERLPVPSPQQEKPSSGVLTLMMNGDDDNAETPGAMQLRKRLSLAEAKVRKLDAGTRVNGWRDLLQAEFKGVADALRALPADARGEHFHAVFDTPVIGGVPSARLKLWYGQTADGARMINGRRMAAVQLNDKDRVLVDCFDPASSAQTGMPRLDYSDSMAGFVVDARDAIETWAQRAAAHARNAEIRGAIRMGFGPR